MRAIVSSDEVPHGKPGAGRLPRRRPSAGRRTQRAASSWRTRSTACGRARPPGRTSCSCRTRASRPGRERRSSPTSSSTAGRPRPRPIRRAGRARPRLRAWSRPSSPVPSTGRFRVRFARFFAYVVVRSAVPRARRGPRAPRARDPRSTVQPPQLGRPAGAPRRAPRRPEARDVRAQGGGHGQGCPQPADRVGRLRDPVPPGEDRPDRDHAARPAGARGRLGHRDRGGGEDPPRRARAAAARRRHGVLRPAGARADRPDRDQRHELARLPAARPGPGRRADPGEGRANREAVDALTARTADALRAMVADFPDPPRPGPVRALADRAVQRLARGARGAGARATAGRARADARACGILQATTDPGGSVGATGLSTDATSTAPASPTRPTPRSTPGCPSSCATS